MPNHVTHRVVLVSQDRIKLEAFANAFFVKDEAHMVFDFNTIVPMPAALRDTESSTSVGLGLALLGRSDVPSGFGGSRSIDEYLAMPYYQGKGLTSVEDLARHIMDTQPGVIDVAKSAIKAFEETGHTDWYGWSIEKWGTKWNAYSFNVDEIVQDEDDTFRLEFCFDTAWSPPAPVFEALATRPEMDGVDLLAIAFDEGWNFAWVGLIEDGIFTSEDLPATAERYEMVYRQSYESDDEDEDENDTPVKALGHTVSTVEKALAQIGN